MGARLRERLALQLMQLIAREHEQPGTAAGDAAGLAGQLKVTEDQIRRTLDILLEYRLIARSEHPQRRYLPARSIDRIMLIDIIEAARGADDNGMLDSTQQDEALAGLIRDIDECRGEVLRGKTLKELVQ